MLEWLKRHAWKACIRQKRISGSNPDLSAKQKTRSGTKFTWLRFLSFVWQSPPQAGGKKSSHRELLIPERSG